MKYTARIIVRSKHPQAQTNPALAVATGAAAAIASTLRRVLDAFREFRVGSNMFAGVDGYGHGDVGRETLDKVYARLFGAEAALVSEALASPFVVVVVVVTHTLRPTPSRARNSTPLKT